MSERSVALPSRPPQASFPIIAWIAPVLENPPAVHFYEQGSWGPVEADELVLPRHWHLTPPAEADEHSH